MSYETKNHPKIRWYQGNPHTTTKPPILQYLVEGKRCEAGVDTYFGYWENVPLFIGDDE